MLLEPGPGDTCRMPLSRTPLPHAGAHFSGRYRPCIPTSLRTPSPRAVPKLPRGRSRRMSRLASTMRSILTDFGRNDCMQLDEAVRVGRHVCAPERTDNCLRRSLLTTFSCAHRHARGMPFGKLNLTRRGRAQLRAGVRALLVHVWCQFMSAAPETATKFALAVQRRRSQAQVSPSQDAADITCRGES